MRPLISVLLILTLASICTAQKPPAEMRQPFDYDLIPKGAVASASIRDLSDLKQSFIALSKQSDGLTAQYLGLAAFYGESIFRGWLKLGKSFRPKGSLVVVAFDKEQMGSIMLPVTSAADVGSALEVDEKLLASGKLVKRETPALEFDRWMALKADQTKPYLIVGPQRGVIKTQHSKGLRSELSRTTQTLFELDDLFITVDIAKARALAEDEEHRDFFSTMGPFFGSFISLYDEHEIQRGSFGLRLDRGFDGTFLIEFEGDVSRKNLTRLTNNARVSDLSGLPTGRVLFATARSSGPESGELIRSAVRLVGKELARAPNLEMSDLLAPNHFAGLVGISEEALARVPVSRAAMYHNQLPEKEGAFSLVVILDTDNGESFVDDLRELVPALNIGLDPNRDLDDQFDEKTIRKMVENLGHDSERVRKFMTTKLRLLGRHALPALRRFADSDDADHRERSQSLIEEIESDLADESEEFMASDFAEQLHPDFRYAANFEQRAGQDIDAIQLQLNKSNAGMIGQLQATLGPDWDRIRLARVENQIVVMLGSNTTLFDQAVENVQRNLPGIEGEDHIKRFRAQSPDALMAEAHYSARRANAAIENEQDEDDQDESVDNVMSSIGLSIWPQKAQIDFFVPIQEIEDGMNPLFR